MNPKRPTQSAIAKAANVSQSLVSLVLNGNREIDIAEETRSRILQVARELGYIRSFASDEGFQRANQRILAYIRPVVGRNDHNEHWIYDSYSDFYNKLQAELVEQGYKAGYTLIVRPYSASMELTHWLLESGAKGVFWHARDDSLLRWIANRYPVVEINRRSLPNSDAVSVDQEAIIALSMDYLRSKGHEQIAYLPNTPLKDKLWTLRIKAYREYTKDAGLHCWDQFLNDGEGGMESFAEWYLTERLRGSENLPTAVLGTDHRMLLVMKTLRAHDVKIPQELSFLGVDNISACNYVEPPLSSIESPMEGLAKQAIDMMISRLKDPSLHYRKVAISTQLVERQSVAHRSASASTLPHPAPKAHLGKQQIT